MSEQIKDGGRVASKWYLGSMNDGLFIINAKPSPAGTDVGPWVNPNGPTLVLNVTELPDAKAQAIVDAHNAMLAIREAKS